MSVVCKRMKTFIDVKIILPFKKEIQNGISEELLTKSISIGFTGGIFPIPGLTLLCSFLLQYLFRGSFIICQSVNVIVTPLHLLSLKTFYQSGMNYILPSSYTMSIDNLMNIISTHSIFETLQHFFAYILGAVCIWFLLSPFLLGFSYLASKPLSRVILKRFKQLRSSSSSSSNNKKNNQVEQSNNVLKSV